MMDFAFIIAGLAALVFSSFIEGWQIWHHPWLLVIPALLVWMVLASHRRQVRLREQRAQEHHPRVQEIMRMHKIHQERVAAHRDYLYSDRWVPPRGRHRYSRTIDPVPPLDEAVLRANVSGDSPGHLKRERGN